MLDLAELVWGRYNGNQNGPVGTYVNLRTMAYFQQASDGILPPDGTWLPISTNATLTATQIANGVNAVLGTTFTAGSFHVRVVGDASPTPGQETTDG